VYDSDEDWEDEPADADECKSEDENMEVGIGGRGENLEIFGV
jgi:hypothetical protein